MHVQPLTPWRSILPWDIPSFGFAGQSIAAACAVMLAGPALSAFAIFHSSECADVVNVPGGSGAVAEEGSSAKAIEDIAAKRIAAQRALLTMKTSFNHVLSIFDMPYCRLASRRPTCHISVDFGHTQARCARPAS